MWVVWSDKTEGVGDDLIMTNIVADEDCVNEKLRSPTESIQSYIRKYNPWVNDHTPDPIKVIFDDEEHTASEIM